MSLFFRQISAMTGSQRQISMPNARKCSRIGGFCGSDLRQISAYNSRKFSALIRLSIAKRRRGKRFGGEFTFTDAKDGAIPCGSLSPGPGSQRLVIGLSFAKNSQYVCSKTTDKLRHRVYPGGLGLSLTCHNVACPEVSKDWVLRRDSMG